MADLEDTDSSDSSEDKYDDVDNDEDVFPGMSTEYILHKTRSERIEKEIEDCESRKDANTLTLFNLTDKPIHLVATVLEVLQLDAEEGEGDAGETRRHAIIKTSNGPEQYFSPVPYHIKDDLNPGDLVAVKNDNFVILEKYPPVYDSDPRLSAMVVSKKPKNRFNDIAGLEKQIQELREAILFPLTHAERFKKIGIQPPKGVLLYGPPGTGKTSLARACAAETDAAFVRLAGPQLVESRLGEGAKIVRDGFKFAKENAPCIIFIDEIDAIGTKRSNSEANGNKEIERTMVELLHQLDGFNTDDQIKVIAATSRVDVLDPALIRSGRLDRKIEFPHPNEAARVEILKIHSCKMTLDASVNLEEVARSADDFNGAQLMAVCMEAGMRAFARDAEKICQEDYHQAIMQVQGRKNTTHSYHA
ncbi:hypothetical protein MKW92_047628 [Papaver armeniacum]|nr:hypothetical protein MKW92_047628 [Papaver armeniacum]